MAIEVLTDFLSATVQDGGRRGYAQYGYRTNGACDQYAMKLANLLAGNVDTYTRDAVLEILFTGGKLRFTEDTFIALTGANLNPKLDEQPVNMYQRISVRKGQILQFGTVTGDGIRTYLGVYGGIQTPSVLGSRSTDVDCKLGGYEGRSICAGDLLPTKEWNMSTRDADAKNSKIRRWRVCRSERKRRKCGWEAGEAGKGLQIPEHIRLPRAQRISYGPHLAWVLRVVIGPQEEFFTRKGIEKFWRGIYQLTPASNRMACRLKGEPVETKNGSDMISDAISLGSIQIGSDGMPIVMMADHQTCGGYAKIGTVIRPDLNVLAQRKPGEYIAFRFISPSEAQQIYREEQALFDTLALDVNRQERSLHYL